MQQSTSSQGFVDLRSPSGQTWKNGTCCSFRWLGGSTCPQINLVLASTWQSLLTNLFFDRFALAISLPDLINLILNFGCLLSCYKKEFLEEKKLLSYFHHLYLRYNLSCISACINKNCNARSFASSEKKIMNLCLRNWQNSGISCTYHWQMGSAEFQHLA